MTHRPMTFDALDALLASAKARKHLYGHALYAKLLKQQKEWIAYCGGTLTGYVNRYGEDGYNIFAADIAELQRLRTLAH